MIWLIGTAPYAAVPRESSPSAALTRGAVLAAGLMLLLALAAAYVRLSDAPAEVLRHYVTSDTLYPVHVVIDVLRDQGALTGWHFAIAPCWFPDVMLVGLAFGITADPIGATVLAGFVQLPLLLILTVLLFRSCGIRSGAVVLAATAGSAFAALFVAAWPDTTEYPHLDQFLLPQMHTGNTINCAAALLLVLTLVGANKPSRRRAALALAILAAVAGASDLLFVPQFLMPATVAIIIGRWQGWFGPVPLLRTAMVSAWCAAGIGRAVHSSLMHATSLSAQLDLSLSGIAIAASRFAAGFWSKVAALDPLHLCAVGWILVLALMLRRSRPLLTDVLTSRTRLAVMTALLSAIFGPLAAIMGGIQILTEFDLYHAILRYTQTTFLIPILGLPAIAAALAGIRYPRLTMVTASVTAVVAVVIASSFIHIPLVPLSEHRPAVVQAIDSLADRYQLEVGYAGYWQARLITLLSRKGVRALPVDTTANPLLWAANEDWFAKPGGGGGGFQAISFVLLDDPAMPIERGRAIEKLGVPTVRENVQGFDVLLFRPPATPWKTRSEAAIP